MAAFPSSSNRGVLVLILSSMLSPGFGDEQRGLVVNTPQASPGYTLIAPFGGQKTFLIDLQGNVVHEWVMTDKPGQAAYLLEDGSLLRSVKIPNQRFNVRGGPAGRIQRIGWNGRLIWDFVISDENRHSHHDIEPMPNGNVLVVVWEHKTRVEAIEAGRDPETFANEVWPEAVLEIEPQGETGGRVMWEWHMWDHLVQSFDKTKPNFGMPSDHPELIDLNFVERPIPDWIHMNSVAYHPGRDQIMLSARTFDEVWVIDHSTTTLEASGHTGGDSGKGGDLLYRWGNPFAYFAGSPLDQRLFGQHDPHWIPGNLPGGDNILIFNNGSDRDDRPYSTVDELTPTMTPNGGYVRQPGLAFGPKTLAWQYEDKGNLYSPRVSGAQRLTNGNTLICSGESGRIFEVTKSGEIVWEYRNILGGQTESRESANGTTKALGGVALFRATRYPPEYPAFAGRLTK